MALVEEVELLAAQQEDAAQHELADARWVRHRVRERQRRAPATAEDLPCVPIRVGLGLGLGLRLGFGFGFGFGLGLGLGLGLGFACHVSMASSCRTFSKSDTRSGVVFSSSSAKGVDLPHPR